MPLTCPDRIEASRIDLRPLEDGDLPSLLEMNADSAVTDLLPDATWTSLADGRAWLERMRGIEATGTARQLVVVDRAADAAIGTCLLFRHEEASARVELGYALARRHWGRGLMREALVALIACAFGPMALRRVEAEVDTRNAASAALLALLGFQAEGVSRQRWMTKGRAIDVALYGLLRGELRAESASPVG